MSSGTDNTDWFNLGRMGSDAPPSNNNYGDTSYQRWSDGVDQRRLDRAVEESFKSLSIPDHKG